MTNVMRRLKEPLRKVLPSPDWEKVKEDLRKLGTTFVPAGILAMLLPPASVGTGYGLVILSIGLGSWFVGVQKPRKKREVYHVQSTRAVCNRGEHVGADRTSDVLVIRRRR